MAQQIQRLQNTRFPGSIRADEDGESLQVNIYVSQRLEIVDGYFIDHGFVPLAELHSVCRFYASSVTQPCEADLTVMM